MINHDTNPATIKPTTTPGDIQTMSRGRASGNLLGIQYLRGIAAFAVVVFHLHPQLLKMGYQDVKHPGLSSGVDLFFVISGFIMWVTTSGKQISPFDFWKRRVVRIVPLYWLITTGMVIVAATAPGMMTRSVQGVSYIIKSYLFIPALNEVTRETRPVDTLGWTLNFEMMFYLVFGMLLPFRSWVRLTGTISILIVLVATGSILALDRETPIGYFTSGIMLEFGWGMALGYLTDRSHVLRRTPVLLATAVLAAATVLLFIIPSGPSVFHRAIVKAVPATAMVACCLAIEAKGYLPKIRPLQLLGDASYSLYLSQLISLAAAAVIWKKMHFGVSTLNGVVFCLFATSVAITGGFACHFLIERPLLRLFSKRRPDGAAIVGTGHEA